jgi:hypothetical protein
MLNTLDSNIKVLDNFTKGYQNIDRFEKMVLNFQTSQIRVFKCLNKG